MKLIASAAIAATVASSASGSIFFESEPNDTIAQANVVTTFVQPGGAVAIDGFITAGDVDWFQIDLAQDATLVISTIGSTTPGADGQMMVVDGSGTDVIAFDDDSGAGLLPAIQLIGLSAGTYYFGVSAFPDIGFADDPVADDILFDGNHSEEFDYKLSVAVNLIPAPGAVALAGLGGLAAVRRRR